MQHRLFNSGFPFELASLVAASDAGALSKYIFVTYPPLPNHRPLRPSCRFSSQLALCPGPVAPDTHNDPRLVPILERVATSGSLLQALANMATDVADMRNEGHGVCVCVCVSIILRSTRGQRSPVLNTDLYLAVLVRL